MHNLENPNYETSFEQEYNYEIEPEIYQESEDELLPAFEVPDQEYTYEGEYDQEYGYQGESDQEVFQAEVQLAEELSAISSEDELGTFLNGLARKAAGAASNFINSSTGQSVLKKLKDIGTKTLPNLAGKYAGQVGSAIGGRIGGQTGAALGKKIFSYGGQRLGSYAGSSFLNFTKFAKNAIQNAANKPGPPSAVTRAAITGAAKKYYPIILRKKRGAASGICGKCGGEVGSGLGYEDEYMGQEIYSEEISDGEVFNEVDEMQLASELLSISNEDELDHFLGGLFKKVAGAAKGFVKSTVGRTLGGMLKKVAKKALPFAAGAIGTAFGGPVGGMIGSKLGTFASGLFEIEPEGLSPEDREFAAARGFVRFAGNAARLASRTRPVYPPYNIARNSFVRAARRHAPGLLKKYNLNTFISPSYGSSTQNGTWYRQGNSIIIEGA